MENPVIILGAKGLGKVALDIFKSNDVIVYCLLDDDPKLVGTEIADVLVAAPTDSDEHLSMIGDKCEAFVATDDNRERKALVKLLTERRKKMPVNAIHRTAVVEASASLGHGNLVAAQALVGSFAKVGSHCIINAGALVDYEAQLADFVQVGQGSLIGPGATVSEGAFIGAGCTLVAGVKVGKNARVGAGSVVIANVPDGTTVFGIPAKKVE
jgi:sugar O-acyltransferase (sialic acid O-acetyltransferase NeuD family)